MTPSILTVLDLVRDALPASLIDAQGYTHLAAIAEQLPEPLTTFWGLETRLGEQAARADILFETRKGSRGHSLLAGDTPSTLDLLCQQSPTWQLIRNFAKRCQDSNPLAAKVRNLWLEFDTAGASSSAESAALINQPNVFWGPDAKALSKDDLLRLILDSATVFNQSNDWHAGLAPLVAALPEGAELFQVGFMLARTSPALRVCVSKLPAQDIPAWLGRIGWQGDTQALTCILEPVATRAQMVALNLNLTADGPAEKIGVECYMDWLVEEVAQWAPLFDWLAAQHLCLPHKRCGLEEFPGMTLSPPQLKGAPVAYLNIYRKIHHLKLSITRGQVSEAKGYLAISRPCLYVDLQLAQDRDAWLLE